MIALCVFLPRLTDNSQKSKTFVGGKLDLTDTIKDGARVVTSGASLRRQLLLAFTEGNNLHIQEVSHEHIQLLV